MAATAAILDLVSVDQTTNAWADWSNFSVAYWGWLEEGSFRWSAPPLIQDGGHLVFGFCRFKMTNSKVDSSDFSVAYWGWLVEGSFWWSAPPLIQHCRFGSHLGFGFRRWSDERLSTGLIFWCLIGGHWGSSIFTMFLFSLNLVSIYPQTMSQSVAYAMPYVALVVFVLFSACQFQWSLDLLASIYCVNQFVFLFVNFSEL
jgi:hypothetical protein